MSEDDWQPDLRARKSHRAMMNHAGKAMEQAVAWAVMAPRLRKTGRKEANRIGTQDPQPVVVSRSYHR